jgi:hypothetical protein
MCRGLGGFAPSWFQNLLFLHILCGGAFLLPPFNFSTCSRLPFLRLLPGEYLPLWFLRPFKFSRFFEQPAGFRLQTGKPELSMMAELPPTLPLLNFQPASPGRLLLYNQ